MDPIQPGEVENEAAMELLRRWAEIDPVSAIEYAASHPQLHGRMDLPAELLVSWLEANGDAAMKWVQALAKGDLRSQLLPTVISAVAGQRPQDALRMASDLTGEYRQQALSALFTEWGEVDPVAAVAEASRLPSAEEQNLALRNVIGKWADQDLNAAIEWAKRLPPGPTPDSLNIHPGVMEALVEKWAAQAPADAARYLVSTSEGTRRIHLLSAVAQQWAVQNAEEALRWAAGVSAEADRNVMVRGVLAGVAQSDVQVAADLVLTLPAGSAQQQGMEMILSQWTARDPSSVATWAASHFKGDGKGDRLGAIVTAWAGSEPKSLGNWLNTLPVGEARDVCCAALARHLATTYPEAAAEWAATISDPALRQKQVDLIHRLSGQAPASR